MNSPELTSAITAIANALAYKLTPDEISLFAAVFVQLGDTLATIAVVQSNQNCSNNKQRFSF